MAGQKRIQDSYACGNLTQCRVETSDTDLCQVLCQIGQALKITEGRKGDKIETDKKNGCKKGRSK
jgi:hypothetical protein